MTAELYAALPLILATIAAASGYLLGRSHGRADGYKRGLEIGKQTFEQDEHGRRREYERGLQVGAASWKAVAARLAEEWANRREWPFEPGRLASNQTERGRRERNFACLDMLCKRFGIPMPERRTNRED